MTERKTAKEVEEKIIQRVAAAYIHRSNDLIHKVPTVEKAAYRNVQSHRLDTISGRSQRGGQTKLPTGLQTQPKRG